jgi:hypothetical protein
VGEDVSEKCETCGGELSGYDSKYGDVEYYAHSAEQCRDILRTRLTAAERVVEAARAAESFDDERLYDAMAAYDKEVGK